MQTLQQSVWQMRSTDGCCSSWGERLRRTRISVKFPVISARLSINYKGEIAAGQWSNLTSRVLRHLANTSSLIKRVEDRLAPLLRGNHPTPITDCCECSVVSARRDPMDCSPPGSSVHVISQARILEWVAISSSRGVFSTQGLNPSFWHLQSWRVDSFYYLAP